MQRLTVCNLGCSFVFGDDIRLQATEPGQQTQRKVIVLNTSSDVNLAQVKLLNLFGIRPVIRHDCDYDFRPAQQPLGNLEKQCSNPSRASEELTKLVCAKLVQ